MFTGRPARALASDLQAEYADGTRLDARIALHAHYSTHPQGFYRWVFDHVDLPTDARLLDIGGGAGRFWTENRTRIPPGWRIILADLAPGMMAVAGVDLGAMPQLFGFVAADVAALPFAAHTFDAVLAIHMLYHVPDRARAYREIARVLRPSGRLYASANSRHTMRRYDDLVAEARSGPAARPGLNDGNVLAGFNLEHGGVELAAAFEDVTLLPYADALVVPTPEPLVAYAAAAGHLAGDALERFGALVAARIAWEGPLRIDKAAGLFVARVGGGKALSEKGSW